MLASVVYYEGTPTDDRLRKNVPKPKNLLFAYKATFFYNTRALSKIFVSYGLFFAKKCAYF